MFKITSGYLNSEGFREGKRHVGIDFAMDFGTPLRAIKPGVVKLKDYGDMASGKTVFIETKEGETHIYGHLSKFDVMDGQYVGYGQQIGLSGNSGDVVGANGGYHLHFAVKEGGHYVDPSQYINDIRHMPFMKYVEDRMQRLTPNEVVTNAFEKFTQALSDMALNFVHLVNHSELIEHTKYLVKVFFIY